MEREGWYSRGYLPHINLPGRTQFITFRLADSLPAALLDTWKEELGKLPKEDRERELYRKIETYLDTGQGSCLLRNPVASRIVAKKLCELDGEAFELLEWVIMPNHVHLLARTDPLLDLARMMQLLKGASAREINLALGRSGRLWQPDYFDRLIRNDDHLQKTAQYIIRNPVKARLVSDAKHWPMSSLNFIGQAD